MNKIKKTILKVGLALFVTASTVAQGLNLRMIKIPGKEYEMLTTEVTQFLYKYVMGENPSKNIGIDFPVESVSWYDAIMFCNKLSAKEGRTPVYAVDGNTDTSKWGYTPHKGKIVKGNITQDTNANGYRLPTMDEWEHAAKGGQSNTYAGGNNLDEVGWYSDNSGNVTHEVGQKKSNGYGLYDMSGNIAEWCWDVGGDGGNRYYCGGSYCHRIHRCGVDGMSYSNANERYSNIGFRILRLNEKVGTETERTVQAWTSANNKETQIHEIKKSTEDVSSFFCNELGYQKCRTPVYSVDGKMYKLTGVELAGTVYSLQDYVEFGGLDIAELDSAIEFKNGKTISQGESSLYTFKDNTVQSLILHLESVSTWNS